MDIAAALGDLDTIKLLHRTRIKCCTTEAMNKAAAIGRLDIVQWLHLHRTEGCSEDAMTYAIAGEHYEIVEWLHEVCGLNCTKDGLSTAAYRGDIDMIKYLVSIPMVGGIVEPNDSLVDQTKSVWMPGGNRSIQVCCGHAVDGAACNGHINIVELLHAYPASTQAMDASLSPISITSSSILRVIV